MQTRQLGWTELHLTVIGFGAWAIGGGGWKFGWGPQDDSESVEAIHRALDLGVNWIDTAAVYGLGHSEEIVGRAIKGRSRRPMIATKCGLVRGDRGDISNVLKRESIRREVEGSLQRLGIDAIDLYQIHWPDPDPDIEEGWETLLRLKEEGKVRYAGVSNFGVAQMKRIRKKGRIASLQLPYSLLRRGAEEDLLPFCGKNKIGVVVYSPMQKGLLTGKMTPERVKGFPADDHRRQDPQFMEPLLDINLEFVKKLEILAKDCGKTPAQLSIAWVLRRPEIAAAIVGARRPSQVEETVLAGDWILSPEEIRTIDTLLKERDQKIRRSESKP